MRSAQDEEPYTSGKRLKANDFERRFKSLENSQDKIHDRMRKQEKKQNACTIRLDGLEEQMGCAEAAIFLLSKDKIAEGREEATSFKHLGPIQGWCDV